MQESFKIPSATYPTLTGDIVTFNSQYAGLPLKSHKIALTATQSGSGTPSPSNPRPISGYSAINIGNAGVNYLPITAQSTTQVGVTYTVSDNGIELTNNATSMNDLLVSSNLNLPDGQFYLTGTPTGAGVNKYRMWVREVSKTSSTTNYYNDDGNGVLFTVNNSAFTYEVSIRVWSGYGDGLTFQPMISKSITDFVPYVGQSITVQIGSTVYGGTYDAITGILTVTHGVVDLGDLTWVNKTTYFRAGFTQYGAKTPINTLTPFNGFCECYKVSYLSDTTDNIITMETNGTLIYTADSDHASYSGADYATYLSGKKLVYELATPTTIQLPPCPIDTLEGVNNIWADTGDTTLQYPKFG